jgi:hypothetical protein
MLSSPSSILLHSFEQVLLFVHYWGRGRGRGVPSLFNNCVSVASEDGKDREGSITEHDLPLLPPTLPLVSGQQRWLEGLTDEMGVP